MTGDGWAHDMEQTMASAGREKEREVKWEEILLMIGYFVFGIVEVIVMVSK